MTASLPAHATSVFFLVLLSLACARLLLPLHRATPSSASYPRGFLPPVAPPLFLLPSKLPLRHRSPPCLTANPRPVPHCPTRSFYVHRRHHTDNPKTLTRQRLPPPIESPAATAATSHRSPDHRAPPLGRSVPPLSSSI
jgi:hypothetical protein